MTQLRPSHLLTGASGALDHLKGAVSGAASSLTLYRLSATVRRTLRLDMCAHQATGSALSCRRRTLSLKHTLSSIIAAEGLAPPYASLQPDAVTPRPQAGDSIAGQVVERLGDADVAQHRFGSCGVPTDSGAAESAPVTAAAVSAALTSSSAAAKRAVRLRCLLANCTSATLSAALPEGASVYTGMAMPDAHLLCTHSCNLDTVSGLLLSLQMLLVCPGAASLAAEMEALKEAHSAMTASGRPHAVVFATQRVGSLARALCRSPPVCLLCCLRPTCTATRCQPVAAHRRVIMVGRQ